MYRAGLVAVLLASSVSHADSSWFARGRVGIGRSQFLDYDEPRHKVGASVGVVIGATVAPHIGIGFAVSLEAPVKAREFGNADSIEWDVRERHYRPLVLGLSGEYRAGERVRIGALVGTQREWVYHQCYDYELMGRSGSGCSDDRSLGGSGSVVVGASVAVSLYRTGAHSAGLEGAVLRSDGNTSAVVAIAWGYH